METINLAIDFAHAQSSTSTTTSSALTGDSLMMVLLISLVVLCCSIFGAYLFWKKYKSKLNFNQGVNSTSPISHQSSSILFQSRGIKAAIIALGLAILLIATFVFSSFFKQAYADEHNGLVVNPDKITAFVSDDGSISFEPCNVTNTADSIFSLGSTSVKIADEAKDVSALNNAVLTINGFNTCIYNSVPDGSNYDVTDASALLSGGTTDLSFMISNLDKDSALSLCGKSVFEITFTPVDVNEIILDAGDDVTSQGTEVIYEKYGFGWFSDEACFNPIGKITCPQKENSVFKGYYSGSTQIIDELGVIKADPSAISESSTLTASWEKNNINIIFDVAASEGTDLGSILEASPITGTPVTQIQVSQGSSVEEGTEIIENQVYCYITFAGTNPNKYYLKINDPNTYAFEHWSFETVTNDRVLGTSGKSNGNLENDTKVTANLLKTPVSLNKNLHEYTVDELKTVSDYLGALYEGTYENNVVYKHFKEFMDNGLLEDGSDNGRPMYSDFSTKALNENAENHWAIDSNGKIATDAAFNNDDDSTIQVRIVGIRQDAGIDGKPIGLTFMTTHVLNSTNNYQSNGSAAYGWGGATEDGSCDLRTYLNSASMFPSTLKNAIQTSVKGYKYSSEATTPMGAGSSYDKVWAPSMFELYGSNEGSAYSDQWPNTNEGSSQYAALDGKVSASEFGAFANLIKKQGGAVAGAEAAWTRSLAENSKSKVWCSAGASLDQKSPDSGLAVLACFSLGTEAHLENYTWEEIEAIADDISANGEDASHYAEFEYYATVGETKTLYLGSDHGEEITSSDRLYMRIIGLDHDDLKADGSQKAGITFMAANAINQGYYYEDASTTASTNWSESKLRASMNDTNGEIYQKLNKALVQDEKVTPVPVHKKYAKAWAEESFSYDETIFKSYDTFFLPSFIEICGDSNDFGDEGEQYPYIKNDIWTTFDDCKWHTSSSPGSVINNNNWMGYLWFQGKGPLDDTYRGPQCRSLNAFTAASTCSDYGGIVSCEHTGSCLLRSLYYDYDYEYPNYIYYAAIYDVGGDVMDAPAPYGEPLSWYVNESQAVAPCFCLGGLSTPPDPPVPPEPFGERVALQETIDGQTYTYAPVFECNNGQTAADLGYHFFTSDKAIYEIKAEDNTPVDSMEDLSPYIEHGLWVEVEPGKGVDNTGKCLAMRFTRESFNKAAYGNEFSTSTDPVTEYKGSGAIDGDYWCGLDWKPVSPSSPYDPVYDPKPFMTYKDENYDITTNVRVNHVFEGYSVYSSIYLVYEFWSSQIWSFSQGGSATREALYWDSAHNHYYWYSSSSLSGVQNAKCVVFSRLFGGAGHLEEMQNSSVSLNDTQSLNNIENSSDQSIDNNYGLNHKTELISKKKEENMYETLSTLVKLNVLGEGVPGSSSLAQTGDALSIMLFILSIMAILASVFVVRAIYLKKSVLVGQHSKSVSESMNVRSGIVVSCVALVLCVCASVYFGSKASNAFADIDSNINPTTTVTANEDGTISIDNIEITNERSDQTVYILGTGIDLIDKSIKDINWSVKNEDNDWDLYEGPGDNYIDGTDVFTHIYYIDPGKTLKLSVNVGIDYERAITLGNIDLAKIYFNCAPVDLYSEQLMIKLRERAESINSEIATFNNIKKVDKDKFINDIEAEAYTAIFKIKDTEDVDEKAEIYNSVSAKLTSMLQEAKDQEEASYWTVKFNDKFVTVEDGKAKYGDTIEAPDDPTFESEGFLGWYTTSDFKAGTEWNFDTNMVGADAGDKDSCVLTLYGKWEKSIDVSGKILNFSEMSVRPGQVNIRFFANDGTVYPPNTEDPDFPEQYIHPNVSGEYTVPDVPIGKQGYIRINSSKWCAYVDYTNLTGVAPDATCEKSILVKFMVTPGDYTWYEEIPEIIGKNLILPINQPQKAGSIFVGWYKEYPVDPSTMDPYTSDYIVESGMPTPLYAGFEQER